MAAPLPLVRPFPGGSGPNSPTVGNPTRPVRRPGFLSAAARVPLIALGLMAGPAAEGADLLQIYELALERDPRLQEAGRRRDAALEGRPQALAGLLPVLSMGGRLYRNSVLANLRAPGLGFPPGGRNFGFWSSEASVDLVQPVDHHDDWVRLAQADSRIAEAEANFVTEQQNLALRTAEAYFNVLLAQDTQAYASAEQAAIGRQLDQAQARYEVGQTAVTDVNEARAGYDQARAGVIAADNRRDNAEEALREIVGDYPAELAELAADIPLESPRPDKLDDWNGRAQAENPGLIAALARAEAARKNIELQFAGHLPTLDLKASAGFFDLPFSDQYNLRAQYERIGMEVNVPLFAGGGVNSRVREARAEFEAALHGVDGRRRGVTRQVKEAYRGVVSAISRVEALKAAVTSSESALAATELGFQVGTRTMVDVLTEQRNLFRARRDHAEARYAYILDSLSLKQAAGRLAPEDLARINRWLRPAGSAKAAAEPAMPLSVGE